MADLTKVGTSLLDMAGIGQYLENAMGFITSEAKASDTKKVGDVAADSIAVAGRAPAGEENNARRRVDGAYFLIDGEDKRHPFSEFMLSGTGSELYSNSQDMGTRFSDELQRLRDEMTQLRLELSRKGYTEAYQPYAGYYDRFDQNHQSHLGLYTAAVDDSQGADAASQIYVDDNSFDHFAVGDHILIHNTADNKYEMAKVESLGNDHKTINLYNKLAWAPKKGDEIYKSYGQVMDNAYYFGENTHTTNSQAETVSQIGLMDDTYKSHEPLKIQELKRGFGYTIRIPSEHQGKLMKSVSIMVQRHGTPAPLMCYLIREKDIANFYNPQQANEDHLIVGQSKPLTVDADKGTHVVTFEMFDPYKDTAGAAAQLYNPNNYPLLADKDEVNDTGFATKRVRYCMVVTTTGITTMDNQNYYDLIALTNGKEAELQTNNMLYTYKESQTKDVGNSMTMTDDLEKYDLYYRVDITSVLEEVFAALGQGMYSASFTTPDSKASNFRATLRIGREGMYHVDKNDGNYSAGNKVTFTTDKGRNYQTDLRAIGEKPVVIGTTIHHPVKGDEPGQNYFSVQEAMQLKKGDPIYPVGYTIRVKAKLNEWDPLTASYKTKDSGTFNVPFTNVIPDNVKARETSSDRLVFETDFGGKRFNDFEFEVFWEASNPNTRGSEIDGGTDTTQLGKELAGRIYDIVATVSDRYVPVEKKN